MAVCMFKDLRTTQGECKLLDSAGLAVFWQSECRTCIYPPPTTAATTRQR